MELWDLFDKDGNPTGETMVRGTPVPPERYHQVIHICIFNPDGKMLIQHRQPFKPTWSGMWDVSVGGAVAAGESVRIAAEREAAEELGYPLDLTDEVPAMRITFPDGFDNFYIVERDLDLNRLRYQPEEVLEARWASKEEIFSMIDDGSFIPYHKSFIEFLFFRRNNSGTRVLGPLQI